MQRRLNKSMHVGYVACSDIDTQHGVIIWEGEGS